MTSTPLDDRSMATSRVLNATPDAVFAAIADPARLARWWGPAGFSNTFDEFDLRPGGRWRFTMHGPDGTDYPNESRFVAVAPAQRVVLDHVVAPLFRLTIALQPVESGQTRVDWHMRFETAALCEALKPICVPANEQNLDRLEAELARGAG